MIELKKCKKCKSKAQIDYLMTTDNGIKRPLWFVRCPICKNRNETGLYYKRGNAINRWQKEN